MKVPVWVEFEKEVEVDVTLEQITAAIAAECNPERLNSVCRGIGDFHRFMSAVPSSVIDEMTDEQRRIISIFFKEQVQRFG